MSRASVQALRQIITVQWPAHDMKLAKQALIERANQTHARIMNEQTMREGIAPNFEAYGNRPGNPIENVTIPGAIVHHYDYRHEVIQVCLKLLRLQGPKNHGLYHDSHRIFINGIMAEQMPRTLGDSDEVMIANLTPYARRIEVGKTESGRTFTLLAEHSAVYERVLRRMQRRYLNVVGMGMVYTKLPGATIRTRLLSERYWATEGRRGRVWRIRKQHIGKYITTPAIMIRKL